MMLTNKGIDYFIQSEWSGNTPFVCSRADEMMGELIPETGRDLQT
jgi:hypothetical protein